jgi:hypothetical protein
MSQEFLNLEELADAHRKLRVEYERTREIVDLLVEKFNDHYHWIDGGTTTLASRQTLMKVRIPTPPPTLSRPSSEIPAPAEPAEEGS